MASTSNASFAGTHAPLIGSSHVSAFVRCINRPPPQSEFKPSQLGERGLFSPIVEITPTDSVKRLGTGWKEWSTESIHAPVGSKLAFHFKGSKHLLVMYNEGLRRESEASIEGPPPSKNKNVANKLTFVPAGRAYSECLETGGPTRVTFLYLEPSTLRNDTATPYAPRIHFEDSVAWTTAAKLKRAIEDGQTKRTPYLAALSSVLALELSVPGHDAERDSSVSRGGLASWQKRIVVGYIEEHLGEQIGLATLAQMARLSQHHFCRAFKHTFGIPPHQYHVERRIERAKILLADSKDPVTEIALTLGYSQTSSFSISFRKMTGWTPSEYRREFN